MALAVVRESPADAFREAGGRAPARREGLGREGTKAGLPGGRARDRLRHSPGALV